MAATLMVVAAAIGGLYASALHHAQELQAQAAREAEAARIEAAWQARFARARDLAAATTLNDDTIQCTLPGGVTTPIRSAGTSAADFLMAVSEQPLIVFIVPGFEYKTTDGWQTFDVIRHEFADEIAAIDEQPGGGVVCAVRWATQLGFGDNTPFLASAIDAVRQLSADPLLPPAPSRRIVVLGYSAGGNFGAYAITHLPPMPTTTATATELRLVTMGAPHHGSDLARVGPGLGHMATGLSVIFASLNGDDEAAQRARDADQALDAFTRQRGVQQLAPDNADVAALNARMAQLSATFHYLNVYSSADEMVSVASAMWPNALQADLSSYRHLDFPTAPAGSPWRRVLSLAFGPAEMTQAAVDAALAPQQVGAPVQVGTR